MQNFSICIKKYVISFPSLIWETEWFSYKGSFMRIICAKIASILVMGVLSTSTFARELNNEYAVLSSLDKTSKVTIKQHLKQRGFYTNDESNANREQAFWLYNAARYHNLDEDPECIEGFDSLSEYVRKKGRETKLARNSKIEIPEDIEGLYALTMQNFESLKSNIAHNYSLVKYGDGDAFDYFANKIANRIRAKYGEKIYDGSWVLANTSFYHVLNTAAVLTKKVGEILSLPTPQLDMHIRPTKTHHPEFGIIDSFEQRYQIMQDAFQCANAEEIKDKNVIYVDDLYASGMHVMEHMRIFKKYGAKSLHTIAIIDIQDPNLELEGMMNFSTVNVNKPKLAAEKIAEIYNKEHTEIVTRSVKYILQLPKDILDNFLQSVPKERIYQIVEAGDNEGYKDSELMGEGLEHVRAYARGISQEPAQSKIPKILFADFDDTIMPTTQLELDRVRAKPLLKFLHEGGHLVIASQEGFKDKPNLFTKLIEPLKAHLHSEQYDPAILANLTVIGGNGLELINFDGEGELKNHRNWGMSKEETKAFEEILAHEFKNAVTRIKNQNSMIKLFLKPGINRDRTVKSLHQKVRRLLPFLEFSVSRHNSRVVYVNNVAGKKTVARDYVLGELRNKIFKQTGEKISRRDILVVGDSMGTKPGKNNDTDMFIFGANNYALGEEAAFGTDTKYLGQYTEGFASLIKTFSTPEI